MFEPERVSAVVFDCDGLLLDTQRSWTRAESRLASKYGRTINLDQQDELLGASLTDAAKVLAQVVGETVERVAEELYALLETFIRADASPLPGARELVSALRGRLPLAVASNLPTELLRMALVRAGFKDDFAVAVGADEVANGKPAPDVYQRACHLLGIAPQDALALEDSPRGVEAARAAGLPVIAVPSAPASHFKDAEDLEFVDSLFDPTLWRRLHLPRPLGEELSTLYTENAKVASVFWEWRHKLLTFFFTAASALFLASAWSLSHLDGNYRYLVAIVPLVVVWVIADGCKRLEERNGEILRWSYSVGEAIEYEWRRTALTGGVFSKFACGRGAYSEILRNRIFTPVAWAAAIAAAGLAIAFVVSVSR